MQRPLSQMIYTPVQTGGSPAVLTLHRYNAFADDMRELGRAVNPEGRILALQSTKGVYIGRTIVGYSWYLGPLDQPSPIHFGDSLAEIERFLWDEIDRDPSATPQLPFLVGEEQGATMALAVAAAVPDLLSGVVAINGALPVVPGWEPPLSPLAGLPVLMVNSSSGSATPPVIGGDALAQTFEQWGGTVTSIAEPSEPAVTTQITEWISQQPVRLHQQD